MLLTLILCGLFYLYSYVSLNLQTSDNLLLRIFALQKYFRSSLRAISTGQLHTLLHFHLRPINQVVFLGPYLWGNLILKGASRLDAFSVYPVRT